MLSWDHSVVVWVCLKTSMFFTCPCICSCLSGFIMVYHQKMPWLSWLIMFFFIVLNLIQFGCPQSATEISNSPSPPACPSLVGHWVPRHSWKDRKIRRCSTSFQLIYVIFPYVLMMFSIKTSNFHAFLLGATAMIFRHPASWQCSLVLRSQSRCTRRAKGASAGIWSGMYGVILGNITHDGSMVLVYMLTFGVYWW